MIVQASAKRKAQHQIDEFADPVHLDSRIQGHKKPKLDQQQLKDLAGKFIDINEGEAEACRSLFRESPVIQTLFNAFARGMLTTGVAIRHANRNRKLHPHMYDHVFKAAWTEFARGILEAFWIYGFALSVVHTDIFIEARPVVLDLQLVKVKILPTLTRTYFKAIDRSADIRSAPFGMTQSSDYSATGALVDGFNKPVPDTIIHVYTTPTVDGGIRSPVRTLLRAFTQLEEARALNRRIAYQLAHPTQFTQEKPNTTQDADFQTLVASGGGIPSTQAHVAAGHGPGTGVGGLPSLRQVLQYARVGDSAAERADRRAHAAARLCNSRGLDAQAAMAEAEAFNAARYQELDTGDTIVHLPPNRQLVRGAQVSENKNYQQLHTEFVESACAIFGVPRSLVFDSNGLRSGNVDHRAQFELTMREWRTRIQDELHRCFMTIHNQRKRDDLLWDRQTATDVASIQSRYDDGGTRLTLPCIVPSDKITEWYHAGLLTYEQFRQMIAESYAKDESDFAPKAQISLKELHNVKPPPIASTASADAASKKHKATKSHERAAEPGSAST